MIFPLGLGHKLIRIPLITFILVISNVFAYFYFKKEIDIESLVESAYNKSQFLKEHTEGFIDYCQKKSENKKYCQIFAEERLRKLTDYRGDKESETIKNNLENTSISDILKTKELYLKYHLMVQHDADELVNIKNFDSLMGAKNQLTEVLESIYMEYDFLSRNNFTPKTLFKSQFNHFDLLHLIGNMVFLIIFGVYIEHRVSPISYIFFYLLGGSMGILAQTYVADPNQLIMGASGNVYAIMGMFYALFFDKKMKFWVWFIFSKKITVEVKYWLPALIFANEMVQTLGIENGINDGVAHIAHLGGLIAGILCGLFLKEYTPLHDDFLYSFEIEEWREAKKTANPSIISDAAVRILEFNPHNETVLEDFIETLIADYTKKPTAVTHVKISKHFPVYFKHCISNGKFGKLFKCLNTMQPYANIEPLLRNCNTSDLVLLGDMCVKEQEYLLAITAYVAFIHSYPNSKLTLDIQKTIKNVFEHLEYNKQTEDVLKILASNSHNVFLKRLLFDNLQQKYPKADAGAS